MKKLACILLLGLALLAVYKGGEMRLHNLENRAVHPDEGEQTWTFARLFVYGDYKYDPNGPHGPILYYWPLMFLNEADKATFDVKDLRKTLFPIYPLTALCIFYIGFKSIRRKNGFKDRADLVPAFAAGTFSLLLFAYSSLAQIYSTYFVQETFFALFSILFAYSFFSFWRRPSLALAVITGLSAGLLQATKETSVFVYAASAVSCLAVFALKPKASRSAVLDSYKGYPWLKAFLLFAVSGFLVYAAINSSFGGNWRGIWDGIASYFVHFFDKSSNPLHSKGFFYYFELLAGQKREYLFFGETGILAFSIIGTLFAFVRRNGAAMFIALFAWTSLLMLSAIGYKMPWLMLSPLYALCIMGGIGIAEILRIGFKPAWAALLLKFILMCAALWLVHFQMGLAGRASIQLPSDPRNPYLYVHTVKDSERLVERVKNVNEVLDGELKVLIAMKHSPWPLPWQFARLGCTPDIARSPQEIPDLYPYSIIIYDSEFDGIFNGRFEEALWLEEYFGLRENLLLRVLVKRDLFEKSIDPTPGN